MRWYLNDASLQGQFLERGEFEGILRGLLAARARLSSVRQNFRSTRSLQEAMVAPNLTVRRTLAENRDRDFKSACFSWLDKTGPFVDDDRLDEADDYFEYRGVEITATGLGEAARRTKAGIACTTFSFAGGNTDYSPNLLLVDHGLQEDGFGRYPVVNICRTDSLIEQAFTSAGPATSWAALIESARSRFPHLEIGMLDRNPALSREPFEASLRDRTLELMKLLNDYVADRTRDGAEGPRAREIVNLHFTGERASFTGESPTNQKEFAKEMTFRRISGPSYFAHWHGKISHRHFRMHFEWPMDKERKKLEILYLGPKITKT